MYREKVMSPRLPRRVAEHGGFEPHIMRGQKKLGYVQKTEKKYSIFVVLQSKTGRK